MSLAHPDPEGHLTDITLTALVKLRDAIWNDYKDDPAGPTLSEFSKGYNTALEEYLPWLDAILEPWGEGPTDD